MALKDVVGRFLLSDDPEIRRAIDGLNFTIAGFQVDPEGYREIGHKMLSGGISVVLITPSQGSHVFAAYTNALDKMSFTEQPQLSGTAGAAIMHQGAVIHESTHALMDYHRFQTTGAIQEAAAYVAETLFYAFRHRRFTSATHQQSAAIMNAAYAVISGRNMISTTGVQLQAGDPDVANLIRAISAHPSYPNAGQADRTSGISGGLINPWYLPRHS